MSLQVPKVYLNVEHRPITQNLTRELEITRDEIRWVDKKLNDLALNLLIGGNALNDLTQSWLNTHNKAKREKKLNLIDKLGRKIRSMKDDEMDLTTRLQNLRIREKMIIGRSPSHL